MGRHLVTGSPGTPVPVLILCLPVPSQLPRGSVSGEEREDGFWRVTNRLRYSPNIEIRYTSEFIFVTRSFVLPEEILSFHPLRGMDGRDDNVNVKRVVIVGGLQRHPRGLPGAWVMLERCCTDIQHWHLAAPLVTPRNSGRGLAWSYKKNFLWPGVTAWTPGQSVPIAKENWSERRDVCWPPSGVLRKLGLKTGRAEAYLRSVTWYLVFTSWLPVSWAGSTIPSLAESFPAVRSIQLKHTLVYGGLVLSPEMLIYWSGTGPDRAIFFFF